MNYWIVQSNPRKFPIIHEIRNAFSDKLPEGYQRMSYWHIKRIPESMSPDDIVFIWKSDGGDKGTRGIYAKAKVFSVWPHHREPLTPDRINAVLESMGLDLDWYDSEAKAKNQAYPTIIIEYTKNLIEAPLKANEIKKVSELKSLLILRLFERTLYDLTEDQGKILDEMTGGSEAGVAMKETKSESHKTDHNHLKEMLYEIGQMKGRIAKKDLPIYDERLDVAWTKILKWTEDPSNVFTIASGDLFAAIANLEHAHRKWGSQPILVTSAKGEVEAVELIKEKKRDKSPKFPFVKNVIKIIGPEDVAKLHDLYKQATNLEYELGIK